MSSSASTRDPGKPIPISHVSIAFNSLIILCASSRRGPVLLSAYRGIYIAIPTGTTQISTAKQINARRRLRILFKMEWNSPDLNSWPAKLVTRVGRKIRANSAYSQDALAKKAAKEEEKRQKGNKLKKRGLSVPTVGSTQQDVNELGEREYSIFSEASTLVEGKKDHTDMMHRLAHHDSFDSLVDQAVGQNDLTDADGDVLDPEAIKRANVVFELHERQFAALPDEVWRLIASYLRPADAASLSLSSRTLREKLGPGPVRMLQEEDQWHERIAFLNHLDRQMPRHLLCFPCGLYHRRSLPGKEVLKADYVANPLFDCPNVKSSVLPRMRLTHGRELPYSFVQLALRSQKHTRLHGIDHEEMARRWKCKDSTWSHHTRYMVHNGHLLMRVVSRTSTLPAAEMTETSERHLLYDREEYIPFFSVCSHWKDGDLMKTCKCALSHVPSPPQSYVQQLKKAPKIKRALASPNFIVRMCDDCRPARRCPECPTEYLVEIQMSEDKEDPVRPFKHQIVVTRWSDLGDGSSPFASPEWVAIRSAETGAAEVTEYDSFSQVGRRAVSGIFESRISGSIPGQRMVSMNPKNKKWGDEGHGWY